MIVITGASKGVGKYIFENINNQGLVFGTYNQTRPNSEDTAMRKLFKVDITDYNSVLNFYKKVELELNNITLINCAGIINIDFLHKSDPNEWKKVIETNLFGTYNMIRVFIPKMREQNYGRIINFSSVAAQKGSPGVSAYAASKSALWGLSKSVAQENGRKGVSINNINLGYTNLGMGINNVSQQYQNSMKEQIPSNSFCEPIEIVKLINYIISAEYLNGVSIDLSGGLI